MQRDTLRARQRRAVARWLGGLVAVAVLAATMAILLSRPPASAASAQVTLTPTSGTAGSAVWVDGKGFPKNQAGQVFWAGSAAGMPAVSTGRNGAFSVATVVPALPAGTYMVSATVAGVAASAPFQIRGGATPTSTPLPTATPSATPTATATATATPTPVTQPGGSFIVFGDGLAAGWADWSWGATRNLAVTSPVYSGSRAISFTVTAAWGALYLHTDAGVNTTPYSHLRFAIRASQVGQRYQVILFDVNNVQLGAPRPLAHYGCDPPTTTWAICAIPLIDLGGAARVIGGIAIQDALGRGQPAVYTDDIRLDQTQPSTATPTPTPTPTLTVTPTLVPSTTPSPSAGVYLGVWQPMAPYTMTDLDSFERESGKKVAIVHWFQDWVENRALDTSLLSTVAGRGSIPMITWMPWDHRLGVNQPSYNLQSINSGMYDAYVRGWAQQLAAYRRPVLLRWAHEMNGNWYPWSKGVNGNTPDQYVAAWRRLHDIFVAYGATNVQWVWTPNVGWADPAEFFPGEAYVDWIGLDGFNFNRIEYGGWQTFSQIFDSAYQRITGLSAKPVIIAETACAEASGKAAWITDALSVQIPQRYTRIKALVWFNENKEADWRISSSEASRRAFADAVASPIYRSTWP